MNQQEIIASLEARAKAAGLPIAEVCKRAGVHPTTFSRWKVTDRNPVPKGASLAKVERIARVISEVETKGRAA